jgi:hypothetical protein
MSSSSHVQPQNGHCAIICIDTSLIKNNPAQLKTDLLPEIDKKILPAYTISIHNKILTDCSDNTAFYRIKTLDVVKRRVCEPDTIQFILICSPQFANIILEGGAVKMIKRISCRIVGSSPLANRYNTVRNQSPSGRCCHKVLDIYNKAPGQGCSLNLSFYTEYSGLISAIPEDCSAGQLLDYYA